MSACAKPAGPSITTSDKDWDLDGDIPELTAEELATMRPAREALPQEVFEALPSRGGRPKADKRKLSVTLRLDPEVVEAFKSTGPGWQTRINAILALAVRPLAQNLDEAEAADQQTKRRPREPVRRPPEAPADHAGFDAITSGRSTPVAPKNIKSLQVLVGGDGLEPPTLSV